MMNKSFFNFAPIFFLFFFSFLPFKADAVACCSVCDGISCVNPYYRTSSVCRYYFGGDFGNCYNRPAYCLPCFNTRTALAEQPICDPMLEDDKKLLAQHTSNTAEVFSPARPFELQISDEKLDAIGNTSKIFAAALSNLQRVSKVNEDFSDITDFSLSSEEVGNFGSHIEKVNRKSLAALVDPAVVYPGGYQLKQKPFLMVGQKALWLSGSEIDYRLQILKNSSELSAKTGTVLHMKLVLNNNLSGTTIKAVPVFELVDWYFSDK